MDSLKNRLIAMIESLDGHVFTYDDLIHYCRIWNYKVENASRRLRESRDKVDLVLSKKGHIVGYRKKKSQGVMF